MPERGGVNLFGSGGSESVMTAAPRYAPDPDRLHRCSTWVRAWTPAVLLRWCWRHRLLTTIAAVGLLFLVVGVARAWADPGTGASTDEGDPLISWMGIKDSDGVPVAKYTLTLNNGSWKDPVSTVFGQVASIGYELYRNITATALWLIQFVLKFQWMSLFTVPFQTIGHGINTAMDRFGLTATALAVLAIIVVCTVLAGKTAKAVSNIAMGMLMMGVAATIFANPLGELVGSDGLLAKGRDTGLQIATSVSDGAMGNSGGKADIDPLVSRLADRFLRSPTQMINFGTVSDSVSRECKKAWSQGINKERGDKLKDDIHGCSSDKGDAMHQKSMGSPAAMLVPLVICGFLAIFLVAFACYFVWHVVRTAVQAMLFAALAPPAFAIGVIPGGPQTFAWKTVLDCAMAYAAMIIYTAAFGAYNVIIDQVFKESGNAIKSLFMTALVLAFGFALFGPLHRMFDRQRDTMAAKLGGSSGGGRSGLGLLNKAADLSRIKQELGGHHRRGDGSSGRPAGRIDSETDSLHDSSSSGGGEKPSSSPASVSEPAGGDATTVGRESSSAAGDGSQGEAAPDADRRSEHSAEPVGGDTERGRVKDSLAAAIRIYRASRGGGIDGSSQRSSMSEVA